MFLWVPTPTGWSYKPWEQSIVCSHDEIRVCIFGHKLVYRAQNGLCNWGLV